VIRPEPDASAPATTPAPSPSGSNRIRYNGARSGRRTTNEVGHALQAQSRADFAEPLPAGREVAAQQMALFQLLQPRLLVRGAAAEPLEDFADLA
jgi:hypothetical protein